MKKKVFSIIGVAAFAVAVAINLNISANNNERDVVLANIEAMAQGEGLSNHCWYYGCMPDWRYNCYVYVGIYNILTCDGWRG